MDASDFVNRFKFANDDEEDGGDESDEDEQHDINNQPIGADGSNRNQNSTKPTPDKKLSQSKKSQKRSTFIEDVIEPLVNNNDDVEGSDTDSFENFHD